MLDGLLKITTIQKMNGFGDTLIARRIRLGMNSALPIDARNFTLLLRIHQMKEDRVVAQQPTYLFRGQVSNLILYFLKRGMFNNCPSKEIICRAGKEGL